MQAAHANEEHLPQVKQSAPAVFKQMEGFVPPYSQSWIDRLTDRLEGFPIPLWLLYPVLFILITLILHIDIWIEGTLPLWKVDGSTLQLPLWMLVTLGCVHYLDHHAYSAMKNFRSALKGGEEKFDTLTYQLVNLPRTTVLVITAISILLVLGANLFLPVLLGQAVETLVGRILASIAGTLAFACGIGFIYHTVRQLILVVKIYREPIRINLFNPDPLYSFSALTARTSVIWILLLGLSYVVNVIYDPGDPSVKALPFFIVLNTTLAILCFFWPLWGIHQRLVLEKQTLAEENNRRLEHGLAELHRRMDEDDFKEMGDFRNGLSGLLTFRDEIKKLSTWPWQPTTFRGVLSAIFLPIMLWLLQEVLSRLLVL